MAWVLLYNSQANVDIGHTRDVVTDIVSQPKTVDITCLTGLPVICMIASFILLAILRAL